MSKRGSKGKSNFLLDQATNALKPTGFWTSVGDEWKKFLLWEYQGRYDEVYEYEIFVPQDEILVVEPKHIGACEIDNKGYIPKRTLLDVAETLGYKAIYINDELIRKFNHIGYWDVESVVVNNKYIDIVEKRLIKHYDKYEWAFLEKWLAMDNMDLWEAYFDNKKEE